MGDSVDINNIVRAINEAHAAAIRCWGKAYTAAHNRGANNPQYDAIRREAQTHIDRAHQLAEQYLGELVQSINPAEAVKVMTAAGVTPTVTNHIVQTLTVAKAQMTASSTSEVLGGTAQGVGAAGELSTGAYIGITVGIVIAAVLLVLLAKWMLDKAADHQREEAQQEAIKQYNSAYVAASNRRMPASQDRRYNLPRSL